MEAVSSMPPAPRLYSTTGSINFEEAWASEPQQT